MQHPTAGEGGLGRGVFLSMRILLQHRQTKRYLAPGGDWSESTEAALEFADLAKARDYGATHGGSNLRVVALAGRTSPGLTSRLARATPFAPTFPLPRL